MFRARLLLGLLTSALLLTAFLFFSSVPEPSQSNKVCSSNCAPSSTTGFLDHFRELANDLKTNLIKRGMLRRLKDKAKKITTSKNQTMASEDARKLADQYVGRVGKMFAHMGTSKEGTASYVPRKDDIILNTFPKAGTAIMQQMLYQCCVMSGGAPADDPTGMEYDDIAAAVPWIEKMESMRMEDSKTTPRVYKTHRIVTVYEKESSKHIVIMRDPATFAGSFLNFIFPMVNPDVDQTSLSDDVRRECVNVINSKLILTSTSPLKPEGPWHNFLHDAAVQKTDNIFIIFYEDVVKDMSATIRRVLKFMGKSVSDEGIQTIVDRCDQNYMANDPKFDGHYEQERMGLKNKPTHTFPKGYKGFKAHPMSPEDLVKLEEMNEKVFGVRTYGEIRDKINAEQLEIHGF